MDLFPVLCFVPGLYDFAMAFKTLSSFVADEISMSKMICNILTVSWCSGLYGNDGLLPARWQLRYTGKPLLEQMLSSPTLLWLGPRLGLDTQTTMELLCLVGALLSLAAMLTEAFRDSLVFFCLWALYLSLYQVSLE